MSGRVPVTAAFAMANRRTILLSFESQYSAECGSTRISTACSSSGPAGNHVDDALGQAADRHEQAVFRLRERQVHLRPVRDAIPQRGLRGREEPDAAGVVDLFLRHRLAQQVAVFVLPREHGKADFLDPRFQVGDVFAVVCAHGRSSFGWSSIVARAHLWFGAAANL